MFEIVMGIDDFLIQLVKYCSCTVTIYGKPSETSLLSSSLAVFALGAGTEQTPYTAGKYIEKVPSYIYAVITNADAVEGNTAVITVTYDMTR